VTDEQMISACQAMDRTAQRILYERMAPKLYATCRRYLRHQYEIEDVLAESFFIIFTRVHQLSEVKAFEGWARRVCVHQCLAYLRKKTSFSIHLDEASEHQLPDTGDEMPLESEDLMRLLLQLPDGCRTVFNLHIIEGYSHKEIAGMLGISEGTSKSQLNKAKEMLMVLHHKHNATSNAKKA